jgi:TRAP-type mannitol/chloroaromatic compound transport system permease small subunit
MIERTLRIGVNAITTVMGVMAGIALLYLIFGSAIDVLMRLALGWGFPQILEYGEVVLVALVYLSLAQTQRNNGHVSVEIVTNMLPPRIAASVEILGLLVVVGVLTLVTDRAFDIALKSYAQGEYRLGMSKALIWPVRFVLVGGLVLLIGQMLMRMVSLLRVACGFEPARTHP